LGDVFWDWGIPTAASVVEVSKTVKVPVIASGGVRDGVDVAKALGLGACLASLSQPMLHAAIRGVRETVEALTLLMDELRNAMFLVGAESPRDLQKARLVVTGRTAEWLRTRGFNIEDYARRGRD
jgi:isopentenyl-diphosphate delta-isomerase